MPWRPRGGGGGVDVNMYSTVTSALGGDGGERRAPAAVFPADGLSTQCTEVWVGPSEWVRNLWPKHLEA
jgi:hypothetical protein